MHIERLTLHGLYAVLRLGLLAVERMTQPNKTLESWLELPLTDIDRASLRSACGESRTRMGGYYRLYAEKKLISSALRRSDGASLLRLARSLDITDYSEFSFRLQDGQGVVIALPHYGHYVVTAINLMEHFRERRDIYMLYGSPEHHPGNALFDVLSGILFGDATCRAKRLHADSRGLATAVRALKAGAILITMPDVCPDEQHAYVIPFLRRQLEIPLGTASLARRSGASLIPAISRHEGPLRFSTLFGKGVSTGLPADRADRALAQASDYGATLKMFEFFETIMAENPTHWQYALGHYASRSPFPVMDPSDVEPTWRCIRDVNPILHAPPVAIELACQEQCQ